jgi:serine/threonine-protein kinase
MAELFRATASGAHGFAKNVVIKRLLPHMTGDANYNAMFIDEAKLTARLAHPKIAQTYELGRFDDQLYIAMEFVDGLDALSMLRECAHRRELIPAEVSVYITHEILDALDFAHNQADANGSPLGIVHRDISPSNVLMSRRGDVKLVDFGIARAEAHEHDTKSGTLKGKYGYMSPEQVVDADVDARSDVFSTGIVLAEMLTGRRLFVAANELDVLLMVRDANLARLDKYGSHIDDELSVIVATALRKNVDKRFQTAAEFREALAEWLFNKRHRVTARDVAEIVDKLYESAWDRKRTALSSAEDERAAVVEAVEDRSAPIAEAIEASIEGIPAGAMKITDSLPYLLIEDDDPAIAVGASDTDPVPPPSDLELAPSEAPAPAPEIDVTDIAIDLGELIAADEAGIEFDLSMLTPGDQALPDLSAAPELITEGEKSTRFPNIEAAVASLANKRPGGDALEFDDSIAVDNILAPEPARPIPTPDEIKASPVPAPPSLDTIEGDADDSGEFSTTAPLGVLYRLSVARTNGLLVTEAGAVKKEIYFSDGVPEYVSSNVAGELFGEYLVKQKVLAPGELAMALAMMPHYGGKLGDTLVGLGLMRPLDVFRQLTQQVRHKLIDVITWSRGTFSWYGGRKNPREAFPLDLHPFEVLGGGAMAVPLSVIDAWCDKNSSLHVRSSKNTRVSPEDFELGPIVRRTYDMLDGRRTIGELRDLYTEEDERARFLRVLYLLINTDLAQLS